MHSIIGYHGTSEESAINILGNNYKLSIGDKEWLGDGVYFFLEGLSKTPQEQASKWAKASAWNKADKTCKYDNFAVIKSKIEVEQDNFLDLTTSEGVEVLEYLAEKFYKKAKKISRRFDNIDGLLINLARGEGILPIDVAKGNFYIRFAEERKKSIFLRTPNSTICSVYETNKNILSSDIVQIGEVKNEIIRRYKKED